MNFSISSKEINHMTTLQGHTDEVTQVSKTTPLVTLHSIRLDTKYGMSEYM